MFSERSTRKTLGLDFGWEETSVANDAVPCGALQPCLAKIHELLVVVESATITLKSDPELALVDLMKGFFSEVESGETVTPVRPMS